MKIATWNVNSIAVRLPQLVDWLKATQPDVVCLQEIKCTDDCFPAQSLSELGYQAVTWGQRTYNGVAILSRGPMVDARRGFPEDPGDAQCRLLDVMIGPVRVINVYVPNGSHVGSEKYVYKLAWLARLRRYFDETCSTNQPLVLCGDFNIAPEPRDVHDPVLWEGRILFSKPEREALRVIGEWGLVDVFRRHHSEPGLFSWWDYRAGAFRRNHGLRIDHLWATPALAGVSSSAEIDRKMRTLERPSDHAPVIAEFKVAVS